MTEQERRKEMGDDEYVARTGDRAVVMRNVKRLVKRKVKMNWNTTVEREEYVEDLWPMIQGCFCGLCKGRNHIINEEDYWNHQIFCCAERGE